MVVFPALNISQQTPGAFLGLWWQKAAPRALPKGTRVKSCSQVLVMATCSCSDWIRLRCYSALYQLCDTCHPPLDETDCHRQLWSTAYCSIPSTCCMSCLHGAGSSAIPWGPACHFVSCCSSWPPYPSSAGKGRNGQFCWCWQGPMDS